MAVWALRTGYGALVLGLVGLLLRSTTQGPWLLALGVLAWLAAAAVTLTGVLWCRHELPEPVPGCWQLRMALLRDTVRRRPSSGS